MNCRHTFFIFIQGYAFVQFTSPFDARSACLGEDGKFLFDARSACLGEDGKFLFDARSACLGEDGKFLFDKFSFDHTF